MGDRDRIRTGLGFALVCALLAGPIPAAAAELQGEATETEITTPAQPDAASTPAASADTPAPAASADTPAPVDPAADAAAEPEPEPETAAQNDAQPDQKKTSSTAEETDPESSPAQPAPAADQPEPAKHEAATDKAATDKAAKDETATADESAASEDSAAETVPATPQTAPLSNPALQAQCGLRVGMLVDLSSSMAAEQQRLKQVAHGVLDTLAGTPAQLSVMTFDGAAPAAGQASSNLALTSLADEPGGPSKSKDRLTARDHRRTRSGPWLALRTAAGSRGPAQPV